MDSQIRLTNALIGNRVLEISRRSLRFAPVAGDGATVIAGDTSFVTRVHHVDGSWYALRVAQDRTAGQEWARHYTALAGDLPRAVSAYFPREISVIEGGITIAGVKIPALLMEWLDGFTVFEAADHAASEGNRRVLLALAESLLELSTALRDARVTHGDLSPDNLMMRSSGDLVCVDLDTVQWPGMRVRSLQAGSAAYRHPRRGAIPRHQDAFAVLVLYTSLNVLADAPEVRDIAGQGTDVSGGGLVFSAWDLADPATSRSFSLAREKCGARTRRQLDLLEKAITSEPYLTPGILSEAMALPPEAAEPERATPSEKQWDLARVIDRLKAEFGDEGSAMSSRTEGRFATTWPSLDEPEQDRVDHAHEEAEAATDESDVPDFSALEQEEALAAEFQERITDAARRHDDEAIVRLARNAEDRHLPLGTDTRRIARLARERVSIRARLERAMAQDDKPALAELARSGELVVLGDTDRKSLTQVLRALEWPGLVQALESDDDALILNWYDEELFGAADAMPSDLRERVNLAQRRLRWVAEVRSVLKRRDARALETLLVDEPENGLGHLSKGERARVLRMIERQSSLDSLQGALREGDSTKILRALTAIEESGARVENPATWSAVQGVLERATVLQQVIEAASANPPDDRELAHLLPVVKRLGLQRDAMLASRFTLEDLQSMVLRGAAVRRIRRAIREDDDQAIRQAAYPDVTGALALLTGDERSRVEQARSRRIAARTGAM